MSRAAGPAVGVALLALCLVAFVAAGRVVAAGHVVVGVAIAAGASLAGLAVLLIVPGGRRR